MIKGIGASSGIAIAKAYKLVMPDLTVTKVTVEDAEAEIKKFDDAMSQTAKELESIKEAAAKNLSAEEAAVFDAHALLQDPELKTQVEDKIRNEKINADAALDEVANTFIAMFESMDDDYFRERAADIKDVSRRLLANLLGKSLPNPALIDEEVVIIADDLTPSDTAQLNKNLVRGFATNIGGRTSHSAIMARSLEIPAVVSCKTITDETNDADMVVLDGEAGIVIINPSDDEIKEYQAKREAFIAYKEELKKMKNEKSVTLDDHHVELVANIGSPKDIQGVLDNGGEGVGLFRTEFLYMESAQLPTEEEQFNVYKEVLEGLEGKPAVVRTLDIGGDKEIEAIDLPKEMNPFLGVRAVRLCFQREDIFRVQLRALLRASVYGDLRIMFPMIATLDEFRKAKGILMEEKEKFINSLLHNYPIPMVLTSRFIDTDNNGYEILDGLQRLNSITSFIENEFPVSGKYFDLSSTAQTLELLKNGLVQQKTPTLSIEECSNILNYPVPISVTQYKDSEFIDETFRRINTGGRKLSNHDIRQAGALG